MSEDLLTKSLGVRWQELAAMVQAYLANNITESRLEPAARAKLNRAGATAANVAAAVAAMSTAEKSEVLAALDAYSKPGGGIPDSDLTAAVRALLDKAGTAVQPGDIPLEANAANAIPICQSETKNNVTFSADGAICSFSGTASPNAARSNLINSPNAMPDGIEAGRSYTLTFETTTTLPQDNINLYFEQYENGSRKTIQVFTASQVENTVNIASTTTGIAVYLYVTAGNAVDGTAKITMLNAWTNRELTDVLSALLGDVTELEGASELHGNQIADLRRNNAINVIPVVAGSTKYGVAFSCSADQNGQPVYTISGQATRAFNYDLINSPNALPSGIVPGQLCPAAYTATAASGTVLPSLVVTQYKDGTAQNALTVTLAAGASDTIRIALGTTGIAVQLHFASGDAVDGTCAVRLLSARTHQEIEASIDTLGDRVTALGSDAEELSQRLGSVIEHTRNKLDPLSIYIGMSSSGATSGTNNTKGISAAIPISQDGAYIRSFFVPGNLAIRAGIWSDPADLSSRTQWIISSAWRSSLDTQVQAPEYPAWLIIEFDTVNNEPMTNADFDGLQIMVVDGTERPTGFMPFISAVDVDARQRIASLEERFGGATEPEGGASSYVDVEILFHNQGKCGLWNENNRVFYADSVQYYRNLLNERRPDIYYGTELLLNWSADENNPVDPIETVFRPYFPNIQTGHVSNLETRAIMSRAGFSFVSSGSGTFTTSGGRYCWAVFDVGAGRNLKIYGCHLASGKDSNNNAQTKRRADLAELASMMTADVALGFYVIGLGDLNLLGEVWEEEAAIVTAAGFTLINGGSFGRYNTNGANPIDNGFLSPGLLISGLGLMPRELGFSDHSAVYLRLSVPVMEI